MRTRSMAWLVVTAALLVVPPAAQAADPTFARPGTLWQATYTENGLQTKLERRSATDWRTLETRVNGDLAWSGNTATPTTLEGKVEAKFQAVPPPTANFSWSPQNPTGPPVQVNYTSTVTCPASPCTYAWTHPDSFGAGSPNPSFTYQVVGTKTVRLVVTDNRGRAVSVTKQVVVSPAPPPPPRCANGLDDDSDGLVDLADPGCVDAADDDESNVVTPPPTGACDRNATPGTFSSEVAAATAGQAVCLASGNYGTWLGTNKAITVKNAAGASPTMRISFGSGDSGFTLDGMVGMGGNVSGGAANITVNNSAFNTCMEFSGAQTNTVFDNNTHNNIDATCGNTRLGLGGSGVTIKNSLMQGGDADGAFILADDVLFANNVVRNVCDGPTGNHADGIQYGDPNGWPTPGDPNQEYGSNAIVRGNFFDFKGCPNGYGQAITSFNSGTEGALIEDNVVDTTRPWGIELYADDGSTVRHNTVRWYPDSVCEFNGPECGKIDLTCCPPGQGNDSPGSGTLVYDNVGVVSFGSATAARNDHNVSGASVTYVGPLTTYAGFRLTSPKGTASDGLDVGIR